MTIHIDIRVLRGIGINEGEKGYSSFSTVETDLLIESIQKHSGKSIAKKIANIGEIVVASCHSKNLPIYGKGDGWFLIGRDASKRNENDERAVINFYKDEVDTDG